MVVETKELVEFTPLSFIEYAGSSARREDKLGALETSRQLLRSITCAAMTENSFTARYFACR